MTTTTRKRKDTTMADEQMTADEQKEAARAEALAKAQDAAAAVNKTRTGKGLRQSVSSTRGRNVMPVTYESFDTDSPDTLPESLAEFMELSGINDESQIVSFLITGFNDNSFRIASDPVAEYVNLSWPADVQKSFKDSVKTLIKSGVFADVESAVNAIRPSVEAKFGK